ncbi:MAG TPA: glycoside hydrolase family 3 N-terminal domain-containing protein [Streptosporangiaceae bacterium]|nr:glycoside hydrolase family 3 N-terminal domain-containing protein [Streptosporangiaceae bacterium]
MDRTQFWVRVGIVIVAMALAVALAVSAVAGRFPLWLRSAPSPAAPSGAPSPRPTGSPSASPSPSPSPGPALPALSLRQLAGQRVIYSYGGLTPPASLLRLISHGDAAGVIFFSQNVSSRAQLTSVVAELEKADASPLNPVHAPLLLMTDQEGGQVRRVPGAPLLSELQIGESADPAAAAATAGANAAQNLRGIGIDVNLAPVLDVYRQPGDFDDQFQRSYSMNPAVVAELGADFITAQQRGGVAATAKHFPGLGAAAQAQDTDKVPVTLKVPLATIRDTDELPYKAAIAAGVRLVMVSWAVYPALDPGRPAGLSATIVDGELRQRLGFKGVTITDALEAGALRAFGSYQNRALLAAEAGMDLILCSVQNVTEGEQATAGLEEGYRDGSLGKQAFTTAAQRVLALRESMPG